MGSVWQKYTKMARQKTIPARVDAYWKSLSVNERQSVLFLDEADLVKQLYKLNFSLLCVGLMQRRLKKNAEEPTYELLEAMEFMDIGTGIMTVKNELVQDAQIHSLFGLIQESLHGFLVQPYVLTDKEFHQLFFQDSESVTSWDEYQHLIAILLEQLILKNFVAFLERESLRQMEALLQEVDKEAAKDKKPKKKKKRRKLDAAHDVSPPTEPSMSPVEKTTHRLNPSAMEFKPLLPLKRKFDSFIVHVDEDDTNRTWQSDEDDEDIRDAELDGHLASIYHLTSEMFGWDFEQQREYTGPPAWTEAPEFLWTDSVVRYFSSHCTACARYGSCRRHSMMAVNNDWSWRQSFHESAPVQDYQDAYYFR
ncbi:hypothetical protein LEN26_018359 [Aphanomyces euteiches]|nr:hypothetical protein LEN26_018359 [Aphanomyces euteiches]KAH9107546.1 hypothetical protein AeMF1_017145 [Aphanomyces euteiches]KAH9192763.1 hypothetical protein AeNC1_005263 [Aphanomyces euteiches]